MEKHLAPATDLEKRKAKIIDLFTCEGKPYELHYQYRTSWGMYKDDKATLQQLIEDGTIELYETTPKYKRYALTKAYRQKNNL